MKRLFAAVGVSALLLAGGASAASAAGSSCFELPVGSIVNGKFVPNPEFQKCLNG